MFLIGEGRNVEYMKGGVLDAFSCHGRMLQAASARSTLRKCFFWRRLKENNVTGFYIREEKLAEAH